MKGNDRLRFIYNQGIRYGAINYYKESREGFKHLSNFLPLKCFNIGENDFLVFHQGFKESKKIAQKLALMKMDAEKEIKKLLSQY